MSYHTLTRYTSGGPVRRGLEPLDLVQDRESGGVDEESQRAPQRLEWVRCRLRPLCIWVVVGKTWFGRKGTRREEYTGGP